MSRLAKPPLKFIPCQSPSLSFHHPINLLLRNSDWRPACLTLLQVLNARVVVHAIVCLVCGVHLLVVLLHGTDDFLCDVL
jgi:hypothetical protein